MKMDEAAKKIGKVMGEFKDKKLKSSSGQKVKSRDQALPLP
jgi:Sec-independent protein translocase protein TatA